MTSSDQRPTMPSIAAILALAAVLAIDCGGSSVDPGSNGVAGNAVAGAAGNATAGAAGNAAAGTAGNATAGTAGNAAAGTAGAAGNAAAGDGSSGGTCPARPPTNGTACPEPGSNSGVEPQSAQCSWGDDPRPECRTTALCKADRTWSITVPSPSCSAPPLPAACPALASAATGQCSDSGLACYYEDGTRCACSACRDGTQYPVCQTIDPPAWACRTPPAGCPAQLPQAGAACADEGRVCSPSCDLSVTCLQGAWTWRHSQCPMCAAPDTPVATPTGDVPISELRAGDLVFSVNAHGVVVVPILLVARTPVSAHRVVRVELETGAVLNISAGHPTADRRTFGELVAGAQLDALHLVKRAELVSYGFDATYDILPASDTGNYFAAGTEIGSTLLLPSGAGSAIHP